MKHSFYRPHDRVVWNNEIIDPATGEISHPPSMTKQSFAAECDINNILKQYKTSGMLTHVNAQAAQGKYLDLPNEIDFQESLNTVIRAEDAFASLPSKLRTRFGNDPAEFMEFCADPANRDEMRTLGLLQAETPPPAPEALPAPPDPKPGV